MSKLVAAINSINTNGSIRARFLYVDKNGEKDVTVEICKAIKGFNNKAKGVREAGKYSLIIPIDYKNGLAEYSYGCGLTHYLQEIEFKSLSAYVESFPLERCKLEIFTPDDIKHILKSNVNDVELGEKIRSLYYW